MLGILFLVTFFFESSRGVVWATETDGPLHYGGNQTHWDRKNDRVELVGAAFVHLPGEVLKADRIVLDKKARTLDAKGNCEYVANESVIHSDEMNFNLDTRTGTVLRGRVSNDRFNLTGERINKLGTQRYQTHWGEFSTCHDCPNSWSVQAEDVDIEFEGYAYLSNVTIWVKGAPTIWLPYLIFPVKKERQSGVLFPRFSVDQNNGFVGVLPIFWATSRSTDMTFGLGEFSKRGHRLEWEGRYSLAPRSFGQANFNYLNDRIFQKSNRWGLSVSQNHQFSPLFEEKLRIREASDNVYPIFVGDVRDQNEAYLTSELIFSYASREVSSFLAFRRFRNLIDTNSDLTARDVEFDGKTVQLYPSASVTTNERFIFHSPVAAGLTVGLMNFTRSGSTFDQGNPETASSLSPVQGTDPIRKALRLSVTPSIYTTFRPWDVISITPSAKYYAYFYSFGNEIDPLSRGYLLFQTDMTTQLEKIYDTGNPDYPKLKHLIRPTLTYSNIPIVRPSTEDHPFLRQITYAREKGYTGYYFDNNDIVPLTSTPSNVNYFYPLGNSITYGLNSQIIRRKGAITEEHPVYLREVELNAGQAFNFRELQFDEPKPLSRFFSDLSLNYEKFTSFSSYFYYPYEGGQKHQFSTSLTYVLERAMHQKFLVYDRSIDLSYYWNRVNPNDTHILQGAIRFSINDYILPSFSAQYDYINHAILNVGGTLAFQSPSQCWRLAVSVGYSKQSNSTQWSPEFAVNFTGEGFFGAGSGQGL